MRWMLALRARLRLLFRGAAEERMDEEMRFHLEMETEQNLRAGMSPAEARRQAILAFGGVEGHRERMRDGRTFPWAGGMSLDLKLGLRMLVKHPALALVGGLGMMVAVAIGAGVFGWIGALMNPTLPLDDGDRVVSIQNATDAIGQPDRDLLHDFVLWRGELKSVEELGAFRDIERNLVSGDGPPQSVNVAEITASGFRVARVPPRLGRYLVPTDEAESAPPVVVMGYDLWRRRFGGDPRIVGRTLQLGSGTYTVVGVMPPGFAFPLRHELWTPLRLNAARYERGHGPSLYVFGRLAPGMGMRQARAELAASGQRLAAAYPDTHARLRPQVMPYATGMFGAESPTVAWAMFLMQLLAGLLVVVVGVNVAVLVYARTAMRLDEIAVRTALGASRRRIVTQLFLEALVLSALAAAAGLLVATVALKKLEAAALRTGAELPFWVDLGLTRGMVAYAAGLAVLGAVIVGVGPGLEATGRRIQSQLQQISSGGSTIRLGRTWMALIVTQVAIAVAVLPSALFHAAQWIGHSVNDPGFGAEQFLTGTLESESDPPTTAEAEAAERAFLARYSDRGAELVRRLEAEPGISAVTVTVGTPGEEWWTGIELEGAPAGVATVQQVGMNAVDDGFFQALDIRLLTGRRFVAGDLDSASTAVVVNQSFVRELLGGGNALGRRVRRAAPSGEPGAAPGRWLEIVGVVSDFPRNPVDPSVSTAKMYAPLTPGANYPLSLTLRMEGRSPAAFAGRFRELASALDPTLRLEELQPLDEILREPQEQMRLMAIGIGVITLSVLLLSSAGIYALMSFSVTRRRKEIGIRAALGAQPRSVLRSVFARAAGQLALGAAVGLALSVLLDRLTGGQLMGGKGALLLPAVAALIITVGILSALGPARRALRTQPMEALRVN